jgi:hypothetical protein
MKFITRDRYNALQCDPESPEFAVAETDWESQMESYRQHLATIRAQLPPSMQSFRETSLHDGVIKSITQPEPTTIEIEIDAGNNPWGPIGFFRLVFHGVRASRIPPNYENEWWLYDEIHLHAEAEFEYRVLLTEGELHIAADEIELVEI